MLVDLTEILFEAITVSNHGYATLRGAKLEKAMIQYIVNESPLELIIERVESENNKTCQELSTEDLINELKSRLGKFTLVIENK